ncbi:hypothetical protein LN040_00675 [Desulfovibrio subterraneus]|jgi:hypothetical protein|uniref:Uncharacterized protein n=1 Tax=Desulfovibrio subterraneus TaxID=2718620 RepID=A0A7J0BIK7_9BACT|nr:hypothetical protein [Desulfovibrio subterraneus]WBF67658.1 hypothetical protein LN040_00675 [Desulfovibrio subterraneus]GFM33490.1 hypothetical protein DSM101010T_18550 [Desulfovibrio subterraneus]
MLLPEKEARFKTCPLLKTSDDKMKFCQGEACMMWRFKNPQRKDETDPGYCGLAGKPAGAM